MAVTYLSIHEAAEDLLQCVCDALTRAAAAVPGHPGCPCRACVVPGEAALDSCDDPCGQGAAGGGQLTVGTVRAYPVVRGSELTTTDQVVRDLRQCGVPDLAVELLVTVARCAPYPTEEGCPPSCEELTQSAMDVHTDIMAVQSAVLCCFSGTDPGPRGRGRRFVLGETRTVGPEGGCVATATTVTVILDGCLPCPVEG